MNRVAIATVLVAALCVSACQTQPAPASSSAPATVATGGTIPHVAQLSVQLVSRPTAAELLGLKPSTLRTRMKALSVTRTRTASMKRAGCRLDRLD